VTPARTSRHWMFVAASIALPVIMTGLAVFVLHQLAAEITWSSIRAEISARSWPTLAAALAATGLSFLAVSQIDVLALRALSARVPWHVASMTGAAAIAIANLLGFSWLTGMSVRYRVYAGYDVDFAKVTSLFGSAWLSYGLAIATVGGVLLLAHPAGVAALPTFGRGVDAGLGTVALALVAGVLVFLRFGPRSLTMRGWSLALPPVRASLALTVLSCIDLAASAAVLWLLLPAELGVGAAEIFVIYVAATLIGTASHAPGGIGVFEATVVAGLGAGGRPDVLAALVLYRVIYYLLPFLVAAGGLTFASIRNRGLAGATLGRGYRLALPLVPPLAATMATLGGLVLLLSGSLPAVDARIASLAGFLPLGVIEASHLVGSVIGVLLLVVARGLWLRLASAWIVAILLLCLGALTSLAKGLDWEEALISAVLASALAVFRPAFYRRAGGAFRPTGRWLVQVAVLVAVIIWIGHFAYSDVAYRDALWWDVALHGDASRYLRASLAAAVALGAVAFAQLIGRSPARIEAEPIPEPVRRLVAESPETEAQIALLGDKAFLVDQRGLAYLSYADSGHALISKGDPVGDASAGRELLWALREKADRMGRLCAFYAVTPAWLPAYIDLGLDIVKIGEVARVDLSTFSLEGRARKDLRYNVGRVNREGYAFEILPKARVPAEMEALRAVSEAWKRGKSGTEKAFALGRFDPDYLGNFDQAIYRHRQSGHIAAFANVMLGAGRHEASVDLMRYDPDARGISMDALFAELMLWAKEQGYHWFSLGAVPFAGLEVRPLAPLWARLGGLVYTHGERVYRFEGLRDFKEKFDPVWTGNYLAVPGGLATARILYDVNILISGGVRGLIR
jgi:phosphatidylglycerol lysyltransferase